MKGLLLKDLYMIRAYCKSYLLIVVIFLVVSFLGGNTFFIYYPCLLCGMIPINLLAYDESSRFAQYSISLPVSRSLFVSEKYIIGLVAQTVVLIVSGAVQIVRMNLVGSFAAEEFLVIMLSLLLVSLLASAIPLPLIFRNGVEKGRIAYYVMIGVVCGAGFIFSNVFNFEEASEAPSTLLFALLAVLGICIYALSWRLSIVFYKKREL